MFGRVELYRLCSCRMLELWLVALNAVACRYLTSSYLAVGFLLVR